MHMYVFKKQGHTVVRGPTNMCVVVLYFFSFFFLDFWGRNAVEMSLF